MGRHAFVDESKRGPYLLCAYVSEPASWQAVVPELTRLRARGASRIHMKNESDVRKKQILSALRALGVTASVYLSTDKPFRLAPSADLRARAVAQDPGGRHRPPRD